MGSDLPGYPRNWAFCAVLTSLARSIAAPVAPPLPRAGEAAQPSGFVLPRSRSRSKPPCIFLSKPPLLTPPGAAHSRDGEDKRSRTARLRVACSTPDWLGLLEHPILELKLPPTEKYPEPGACISPTLGAQGCSSAASLEKLIFPFF